VKEKAMTADTQIKFNLWAVLGFLVIMGASSFTFLYAEGKETKVKQQEVIQRVTILEANYANIIKGIDKLTVTVEKSIEQLDKHRQHTEKKADK
jgi:hypothetical protein